MTLAFLAAAFIPCFAAPRVKVRGYITAKTPEADLQILQDVIQLRPNTRLEVQDAPAGRQLTLQDLTPGTLIEAEGTWKAKHQFEAEKIKCDWDQFDKQIKESAFLEQVPKGQGAGAGTGLQIRVDGETLVLDDSTKAAGPEGGQPAVRLTGGQWQLGEELAGRLVRYRGVRRPDGTIAATELELGSAPPADAYEIGQGIKLVRSKDSKTNIDILEFQKKKDVVGRLKLFPVPEVQDYVSALGEKLVPAEVHERLSRQGVEFRFYVIENGEINASALPDGAILVNTGLLGVLENEAELAFVLSHEIAHITQAHSWRHVHDTRTKRILLEIAAVAASAYIGDLANFLGELGLVWIWNGYGRRLENQADRLALQSLIEHGYDPRQAARLSEILIERYGGRTTSAVWSSHESNVLRGSFLTVQVQRQYPQGDFADKTTDTEAFRAMRQAMGPVKSM
jgi:hypothetical protein